MPSTPTIKLNDGQQMPAIGFGTWHLADGEEAFSAVSHALKDGYRLIDTAKIYGNESGVGEAVRKSPVPREEIFVTTKLWPSDFGYARALDAFEGSLDRLGLKYVDLYLVHWPERDSHLRQESWRALIELQKQAKARSIGVSNYMVEHLEELLRISDAMPSVNQIEFHPYIYKKQRPVLEFCRKHKIAVEAYSPLNRGLGLESITVTDIAEKYQRTPAQVVLRWAIQHGTIPIPKSATPQRIKQNLEVSDFKLAEQDMEAFDSLSD